MAHFSQDFIAFFKELAANNHKEWFDDNRKRYESTVKNPFKDFIQTMIERVREDDPSVRIEAKDAIMRINRDIRFSKDKTPYNTHVSAIISAGGRKDKSIPGIYLQLGAEDVRFYGGAHMVEKEQLADIRNAIADDLDGFDKLINSKDFKDKFGGLHGDKHKRLAPELKEAAEKQPLLFNKNFYYYTTFKPEIVTHDDFEQKIMDHYYAAKPVKEFLAKAMGFEVVG